MEERHFPERANGQEGSELDTKDEEREGGGSVVRVESEEESGRVEMR